MDIIQRIVPATLKNVRPGGKMKPEYITVHNTANTSKGANAELHSRYLLNGAGGADKGWHFTVDEKDVYQHLPTDEHGWHAGDGSGNGNKKSIGIEICENEDGDFEGAVQKAAELVGYLMKVHNVPSHKVVPHKHWSGKQCPRKLLDRWQQFINLCIAERGKLEVKTAVTKPDYLGSSFEKSIKKAIEKGVILGYDQNTFKPNEALTRGQFAAILDRLGLLD